MNYLDEVINEEFLWQMDDPMPVATAICKGDIIIPHEPNAIYNMCLAQELVYKMPLCWYEEHLATGLVLEDGYSFSFSPFELYFYSKHNINPLLLLIKMNIYNMYYDDLYKLEYEVSNASTL